MSYGVGWRPGSDPVLWCRPADESPIWPLAWEIPFASDLALKKIERLNESLRDEQFEKQNYKNQFPIYSGKTLLLLDVRSFTYIWYNVEQDYDGLKALFFQIFSKELKV